MTHHLVSTRTGAARVLLMTRVAMWQGQPIPGGVHLNHRRVMPQAITAMSGSAAANMPAVATLLDSI
jgi:hypothetical protein